MPRYSALALLALAPFLVQAQKRPITLEDLAGAPGGRSSEAVPAGWFPDGKRFLVRQQDRLEIYDPATRTAQGLVSTSEINSAAIPVPPNKGPFEWLNRRERRPGPQFSDSGKELLYPAGGDLFLITVENGKWKQLTRTPVPETDPKLSPDGKTVAFRRGQDLYTVDAGSGKETRLTEDGSETLRNGGLDWVYPEELELGTAYWWSPDSKSILYLQFDTSHEPLYPHSDLLRERAVFEPQRYPQAGENNADIRVGVIPAAGGATKWFEAGNTRSDYLIARAGWLRDSRGFYIIRLNRVQNKEEVILYDLATGKSRTILRESDKYWINLHDPYFLKSRDEFIWPSERDGFTHLYVYDLAGRQLAKLGGGEWEVFDIDGVDESAGRVLYTSDEGSSLERHLFSVRLDGTDKRKLTSEPGTHRIDMGPGAAYYLDTYSSLQSPRRTVLHAGDGRELGVFREADRGQEEEFEILPTEIHSFKTADGTLLYGRLIKPAGFQPGKKYPMVVSVYGGPGVGLPIRNAWSGISIDQVFAQAGFVVWESENRGGEGRGHAFETPIYHRLGVVELADQVAGVKYVESLGFVDPARVGIQGWSYGGFMTVNALLSAPDVFRCGVAGAPPTNWLNYDTIYTERYMGLPSENKDGYADTALPPKAANLRGRLMLMHNYEDDNVLFQNTVQLVNALEQAEKVFDMALYTQHTHSVSDSEAKQMNKTMLEFFERWLK